jgi:hypothetical protein
VILIVPTEWIGMSTAASKVGLGPPLNRHPPDRDSEGTTLESRPPKEVHAVLPAVEAAVQVAAEAVEDPEAAEVVHQATVVDSDSFRKLHPQFAM